MEHMDPARAARVWQRVQASLNHSPTPPPIPVCTAPPLQPIPVYTTPPEAWQQPSPKPRRKKACRQPTGGTLPWSWLLILILLLSQKNI